MLTVKAGFESLKHEMFVNLEIARLINQDLGANIDLKRELLIILHQLMKQRDRVEAVCGYMVSIVS